MILVTSSLTIMFFHIVRHQLLHGDGLPLSLVGVGFTFTKLDFLWSPSAWLGLRGASSIFLRALIVFGLFVMGGICLLIGPASAVLMLPRNLVCDYFCIS